MAIVDVYESLTANRVYRQGMSPENAKKIIVEGDGRVAPDHFDPKILSLFSSHHQEFAKIASSI
jgi:HD-GYP domain-containing protein (c-di-GMP phosphodiesterase class II)